MTRNAHRSHLYATERPARRMLVNKGAEVYIRGRTVCLHTPHIDNGSVGFDMGESLVKVIRENEVIDNFKIQCRSGFSLGRGNLTCINGTWTGIAPACVECGKTTSGPERMTSDGDSYQYGVAPWHVGVYSKLKKPYKLICGGSLISAKYILSAAQCFWDDAVGTLPAPIFAVAVGKVFGGWDDERDFDAQTSAVDDIKIPGLFQGEADNLMNNVAIVVVTTPFEFTKNVKPVCIDYSSLLVQQSQYLQDMVTVWKPSTMNTSTQVANTFTVESCAIKFSPGFDKYLTSDKTCTTYYGAAFDSEVAGSGLVYNKVRLGESTYFLEGIASVGTVQPKLPTQSQVLIFTNVLDYRTFITKYHSNY